MVVELGNFWLIGKLGQVWGKYERNGEACWDVGGQSKCGKMCWGRCGELCLECGERCGKYVGVGGEVWEIGKVWGGGKMVGRCVEVCLGGCGKVCLGVGKSVGNVLGVRVM